MSKKIVQKRLSEAGTRVSHTSMNGLVNNQWRLDDVAKHGISIYFVKPPTADQGVVYTGSPKSIALLKQELGEE